MKDYKAEIISYINKLDDYHLRAVWAFVKRLVDNKG